LKKLVFQDSQELNMPSSNQTDKSKDSRGTALAVAAAGIGVTAAAAIGYAAYKYFNSSRLSLFCDPECGVLYPRAPNVEFSAPLNKYMKLCVDLKSLVSIVESADANHTNNLNLGRKVVQKLDENLKKSGDLAVVMKKVKALSEVDKCCFKFILSHLLHTYRMCCPGKLQEGIIHVPDCIKLPLDWLCDELGMVATATAWDSCMTAWQHSDITPGEKWTLEDFMGDNFYKIHYGPLVFTTDSSEKCFKAMFLLPEVFGAKIYPPMFESYTNMKEERVEEVGRNLVQMTHWLRQLNTDLKKVWTFSNVSRKGFADTVQALIWVDGKYNLGTSGYQIPLFQMLNQYLAIHPNERIREILDTNAGGAFPPRYRRAFVYVKLRRGRLCEFLRQITEKKKDDPAVKVCIEAYNKLVKELMAFRAMHRSRAAKYFETDEHEAEGVLSEAKSSTGVARSDFLHEMDELIEGTKGKLWTNERSKSSTYNRTSFMVDQHQKRHVSVLVSAASNKKTKKEKESALSSTRASMSNATMDGRRSIHFDHLKSLYNDKLQKNEK